MTVEILLAMKVLYLAGLFFSQHSTIVLSHQAPKCSGGISNVLLVLSKSSANKTAPHNSNSGIVLLEGLLLSWPPPAYKW